MDLTVLPHAFLVSIAGLSLFGGSPDADDSHRLVAPDLSLAAAFQRPPVAPPPAPPPRDTKTQPAPPVPAGEPTVSALFTDAPRTGRASLRAGMGFTADPGTFLMALEADFFMTRNLSLGPLLQLGVSDDPVIVAPSLNFQWMFDLPRGLERLKPFAQWGLGAAYLHDDRRRRDDDDAGFLLNAGFGVEFCITDSLGLGSNMLFNFLPDKVLGEHFFFAWQMATVTFRF